MKPTDDTAAVPGYDQALAQKICQVLNEALEADRPAIAALCANRVPCNTQLAEHPTIQVTAQHGGFFLGLLGILNGICGVREDGNGPICMVWSDEPKPKLLGFSFTPEPTK
jgi:hypothetical protein